MEWKRRNTMDYIKIEWNTVDEKLSEGTAGSKK